MNPLLGVCLTNLLYVTQKYVRSLGFHCVQSSTQATISPQEQEANLETTGAPLISISEIIVELMQYIRAPLVTALDISTAFLEYKMCKHIENLLLFLVFLHTSTSQI